MALFHGIFGKFWTKKYCGKEGPLSSCLAVKGGGFGGRMASSEGYYHCMGSLSLLEHVG
jgi:hypothetical protein